MKAVKKHIVLILLAFLGNASFAKAQLMNFENVRVAYRPMEPDDLSFREHYRIKDEASGLWRVPTSEEHSSGLSSISPTPNMNLSEAMQRLSSRFTRSFNRAERIHYRWSR